MNSPRGGPPPPSQSWPCKLRNPIRLQGGGSKADCKSLADLCWILQLALVETDLQLKLHLPVESGKMEYSVWDISLQSSCKFTQSLHLGLSSVGVKLVGPKSTKIDSKNYHNSSKMASGSLLERQETPCYHFCRIP